MLSSSRNCICASHSIRKSFFSVFNWNVADRSTLPIHVHRLECIYMNIFVKFLAFIVCVPYTVYTLHSLDRIYLYHWYRTPLWIFSLRMFYWRVVFYSGVESCIDRFSFWCIWCIRCIYNFVFHLLQSRKQNIFCDRFIILTTKQSAQLNIN